MVKLILPKSKIDLDNKVIFLAGPITGAPKWQDEAVKYINNMDDKIYIASPRRDMTEQNMSNSVKGDENFNRQLEWERYYLDRAAQNGSILFWLPKSDKHDCNRSYARDTRGELGEWRGRMMYNKSLNIIIGGEEDFDGLDIIKRNFQAVREKFEIYSSLEETCAEAVKQANGD